MGDIILSGGTTVAVTGSVTATPPSSVIDSNNTTAVALGSNASFTGTGTDVLAYTYIDVTLVSDQNSAAGGVKLEWSNDNSTWIDTSAFSYVVGTAPNAGQSYGVAVRSRYFRVVYTNGASAQGSFNLTTRLFYHNPSGDASDISLVPVDGQHAFHTKSVIYGKTTAGGGSYIAAKVNPSGSLAVAADLTTVGGSTVALGQAAMAASIPVVIASNQTAVPTNTKTDLAPASPTAATVGVTSAQAVASNSSRKGLVLVNTSANIISLGFGAAAVLNSGITLYPGGTFCMDEYSFDTGAVNAIASVASSNLAIQEYS